jgi:hypothetical protein
MIPLTGCAIWLKPLSRKPHIIYGKNMPVFCLNNIGRRKSFGQMVILPVVLAKFSSYYTKIHRISRIGGRLLLPPPKGSGRSNLIKFMKVKINKCLLTVAGQNDKIKML